MNFLLIVTQYPVSRRFSALPYLSFVVFQAQKKAAVLRILTRLALTFQIVRVFLAA